MCIWLSVFPKFLHIQAKRKYKSVKIGEKKKIKKKIHKRLKNFSKKKIYIEQTIITIFPLRLMIFTAGNSHQWLPPSSNSRRSSNASDCTHRARPRRRDCPHSRGRLERAISSDSRLTGATARCHHHAAPLLAAHVTPNTSPSHSMLEDDSSQQNSCA